MTEDIKEVAAAAEQQNSDKAPNLDKAKRDKNRQANLASMQLLLDAYPEVFNLENPRPLKIGIHDALAADGKLSKTKIRRALATYVRQSAYLHCLRADADRINLEGQADGKVSAEESEHARLQLNERRQKRQARLANQESETGRPARRPKSRRPRPDNNKADRPKHEHAKKISRPKTSSQLGAQNETPSEDRMKEKLDRLLATLGGPKN